MKNPALPQVAVQAMPYTGLLGLIRRLVFDRRRVSDAERLLTLMDRNASDCVHLDFLLSGMVVWTSDMSSKSSSAWASQFSSLDCEGLTAGAADPEGEHDDGGGGDDDANVGQSGPRNFHHWI